MNIFVGNLLFESTENEVRNLFEKFGAVSSVAIVMSKEKKAPKSRGFGFVEMPDEAQALAAIAALNEQEFMGRVLKIEPARPKKEKPRQEKQEEKVWVSKPGTYKGGRRTRSYVKEHGPAALQKSTNSWQRNKNNPLRWRKKSEQPKPWQKSAAEHKPWNKSEGEAKPWKKKTAGAKPWEKSGARTQKSGFNPLRARSKGPRKPSRP